MSAVEYSLIFLSIVISYVVTVAMVGWGKLIKHYNFQDFSLSYLLWTLILFIYLLFIWFWTFSYHLGFLEIYLWFTLILIRPLLIYFCFEVLTPTNQENANYAISFLETRKKFFTLVTILWVYEIGLILFMKLDLLSPRGVLVLINLAISVGLIFIKNELYIRLITILAFVIIVVSLISHVLLQFIA